MEKNYFNSVDKLDISSLILLIIGIVLLIYSFLDVFRGNYPVLIAIPATYCVYVGLTHLTKKEETIPETHEDENTTN